MNFDLDDDQRAFADSARSLFSDFCSDEQLREFDASGQPFMRGLWDQCVANGLHLIVVPGDGGLGLGMTDLMPVLEQQGRALALVPLWEQQLGMAALAQFGAPPLRDAVLDGAQGGNKLLTLSLAGPALRASRQGETLQLNGRAAAVPLGAQAHWALLAAELDAAPRLLLVDLQAAGVQRMPGVSQHHLAVADLVFDGTVLQPDALLAEGALHWLEPRAIACLAALQLGVSAQQLLRTVEYVGERRQFERAIGSFQLVAGAMADGHIAVEALRSSLWQLVYRLDAGQGALPQGWATRFLACEMSHRVGHMAQHVHGGIGVDTSFHIHRFLFWSRALGAALGGTEHNLAKLGDWLADNDTLGWKYDLAEDAQHPAL